MPSKLIGPRDPLDCHVRYITRADIPALVQICEEQRDGWSEEELKAQITSRDLHTQAAEADDVIVGFVTYRIGDGELEILYLAVPDIFRRHGVATKLINHVKKKMRRDVKRIRATVNERNLPVQLFLRSQNFKAIKPLRRWFSSRADGILFECLP